MEFIKSLGKLVYQLPSLILLTVFGFVGVLFSKRFRNYVIKISQGDVVAFSENLILTINIASSILWFIILTYLFITKQ